MHVRERPVLGHMIEIDLNQRPLDNEACAQPLSCNCCRLNCLKNGVSWEKIADMKSSTVGEKKLFSNQRNLTEKPPLPSMTSPTLLTSMTSLTLLPLPTLLLTPLLHSYRGNKAKNSFGDILTRGLLLGCQVAEK